VENTTSRSSTRSEPAALRLVAAALALAVCPGACSSVSATYDYDTRVNFSEYRTFDWAPEQPVTIPDPRREAQVKDQFVAALEARGYERVSGDPDFLLVMYAGADGRIEVSAYGYGYGPRGTFWGPTAGYIDTYAYREGTLVLDVVDAARDELVWRGTASGVLDAQTNPEERQKLVTEAVDKILKNFPPPANSD
jgi:hypothetical protein